MPTDVNSCPECKRLTKLYESFVEAYSLLSATHRIAVTQADMTKAYSLQAELFNAKERMALAEKNLREHRVTHVEPWGRILEDRGSTDTSA